MRALPWTLPLLLAAASAPTAAAASKRVVIQGSFLFVLSVVAGFALLLLGITFGWRAKRPKPRAPPRRSFAAGRRLAVQARPVTIAEAFAAIRDARLGEVVEARQSGPDAVVVAIARRRSQPCEAVAGFVAGALESAWASDVRVGHEGCAGKKKGVACRYEVRRRALAPPDRAAGISPAGRRAEGSSTRGSPAAPRRSRAARPDGG